MHGWYFLPVHTNVLFEKIIVAPGHKYTRLSLRGAGVPPRFVSRYLFLLLSARYSMLNGMSVMGMQILMNAPGR
jgi:hypothetical protein